MIRRGRGALAGWPVQLMRVTPNWQPAGQLHLQCCQHPAGATGPWAAGAGVPGATASAAAAQRFALQTAAPGPTSPPRRFLDAALTCKRLRRLALAPELQRPVTLNFVYDQRNARSFARLLAGHGRHLRRLALGGTMLKARNGREDAGLLLPP